MDIPKDDRSNTIEEKEEKKTRIRKVSVVREDEPWM
jgi:hypothetical protein